MSSCPTNHLDLISKAGKFKKKFNRAFNMTVYPMAKRGPYPGPTANKGPNHAQEKGNRKVILIHLNHLCSVFLSVGIKLSTYTSSTIITFILISVPPPPPRKWHPEEDGSNFLFKKVQAI